MEFGRIWILRGPNLWSEHPVIEMDVDLGNGVALPLEPQGTLLNTLKSWDVGLELETLSGESTWADLLLLLTRELLDAAGDATSFGIVRKSTRPGWYRVIFAYEEEKLGRACLDAAQQLCQSAREGVQVDWRALTAQLNQLANEVRLGPSTRSIYEAARRRGLPVRRLSEGSLVQIGWGEKQKRIWTAETDNTPAIAETIAQDKQLTRNLLQAVGVPIPYGRPVNNADEAWSTAEWLGLPVVVKPQFGNQGRGVATNLQSRDQVIRAYESARAISSYIVVEKFVPGADHRLLVVGETLAAAALREPAHVIGDGKATIVQLIAEVNRDPRRSDGHATPLSWIKLDPISLEVLAEQQLTPDSIPSQGRRVSIRRNANLSTGGTAADVTDLVHPSVAAKAIDAAKAIGLDVAGVDIVVEDISKPLEEQGGAVVEVNAGPGLRMHLEPSAGSPRAVGRIIVDALFPLGSTGRIPIVAVTGVNGKTTTARVLAHILRTARLHVGLTCTDGIYLDGRRTETRDCSGPYSARSVLLNPRVQAAILETARGGILREGLGFDQCTVAVVTNIGKGDHLGLRGIETLEQLTRVKEVVVRAVAPEGFAVLNAADPRVVSMAPACPGRIAFFARDPEEPVLARHRSHGGRAAFVSQGRLILANGSHEDSLLALDDIPFTHHGIPFQIENALAAASAAWCLGQPLDVIRQGLGSFAGSAEETPGRFNVLVAGESTIIVDYAHNPSAVSALVAGIEFFPHPIRTLVFSGCDRREIDLLEMGEEAGHAFDRVILYADWGHAGRADGELNTILKRGLAQGKRVKEIIDTPNERAALELALNTLKAGELLVLGVEAIEESLAFVRASLQAMTISKS